MSVGIETRYGLDGPGIESRTIQHWNQLPAEVLGTLPCNPIIFKRIREVINELN